MARSPSGGTRAVLVTGASRGIGRAIRDAFERAGDRVLAPSRSELDMADPASIAAYLAGLDETPCVLVNNAGTNRADGVDQLSAAGIDDLLSTNLRGPLLLAAGIAARLRAEGRAGWILNVSSAWAIAGRAHRIAYSASKAGLAGATRALAAELAPHGIVVNALAPGFVHTELIERLNPGPQLQALAAMVPVGRLAEPAEMAQWAVRLCEESNRYLTGQTIVVDGGLTSMR